MKTLGMIALVGLTILAPAPARPDDLGGHADPSPGDQLAHVRAAQAEASRLYHLGYDRAKDDRERERVMGAFLEAVAMNSDRAVKLADELRLLAEPHHFRATRTQVAGDREGGDPQRHGRQLPPSSRNDDRRLPNKPLQISTGRLFRECAPRSSGSCLKYSSYDPPDRSDWGTSSSRPLAPCLQACGRPNGGIGCPPTDAPPAFRSFGCNMAQMAQPLSDRRQRRGALGMGPGAVHISLVPESGWPHPILFSGFVAFVSFC